MTVLQKNAATGVDLGQIGRTLGKAAAIGAIAVGVVFAVNSNTGPQNSTPAQIEQVRADALVERFQNQYYAEANALNKADIGVPSASTAAPFLSGTSTPTHTGRTSGGTTSSDVGDKADLVFKQKGAALADPADRIHKQRAADLAE
jgi:hypothetical protein